MVRNAGGYADPAIASTVANALMLAGERQGACAVVGQSQLTEAFSSRANAACRVLQGDTAAALAAPTCRPGQIDGPALMAIDLTHAQVPASVLRNTQPSIVRALVGLKALPIATRIEIAERGEALAIIEATKLGDLYLEAVRDGAALPPAIARRARMVAAARNASNPDGDGQFDRRRLRRGARQPAVSHHRAGERRRLDQSAGPAAVRQRGPGSDARLPAAGRQAAGAGLDRSSR